jgi:hypothetical protein
MNVIPQLVEWIKIRKPSFTYASGLSIVKMGDDDDLLPPFLGLMEASASPHETAGVILRGVSDIEITIELHTVPASEDQAGTRADDERRMRDDVYDILADMEAIEWLDGKGGIRVFDIRVPSPTTEASDGRRISRWSLQIVACPT